MLSTACHAEHSEESPSPRVRVPQLSQAILHPIIALCPCDSHLKEGDQAGPYQSRSLIVQEMAKKSLALRLKYEHCVYNTHYSTYEVLPLSCHTNCAG
jgi:hypothetical protein